MIRKPAAVALMLLLVAFAPHIAAQEASTDLRQAVPPDAYVVVYAQHNPERDFQRQYYEEVFNTIQETRIIPRVIEIVTSRMAEDDLEAAQAVFEEFKTALEPVDGDAVLDCKQFVYAQKMGAFTSQHLVLLQMTPEAAAGCAQGVQNLFGMAEKYSQGGVPVETWEAHSITLTSLAFPREVPFGPTVAHVNDVFLFASTQDLARQGVALLLGQGGPSKFDDPRLKAAFAQLPRPEDAVRIYDGKQQVDQLRGMVDAVRERVGDNPEADRWAALAKMILDQLGLPDYVVTVEYTEGNHNVSASLGKLRPGYEDKLLTKVLGSGQAFEDWQRWVPADAVAYSLSTGANLHPVYEFVADIIQEHIPEAQEGWQRLEAWQQQIGVHLDRDILQAFSGESVSVTLPAEEGGGHETVLAMRCHNPERIRELLHQLVEHLQQISFLKAQQLQLIASEQLEGFDSLSAAMLTMFGAQPVIGFHDGWMIIGSSASAVQQVLATKAGDGPTIADTENFKRFGLQVKGPVHSISYKNLAESTRRTAEMLNQAGTFAPMIIGMLAAQADPEDLKPIQELAGLLPDLAKIVAKFDFLEAQLSVTQEGPTPDVWRQRSVTLVRPPADRASESAE